MAGSPRFSQEAARVLVDAYLAMPEGGRDLRKVLAAAKQAAAGNTDAFREFTGDDSIREHHRSVVREIAGMSKSQAYELLREDPRYQPTTEEQAEELSLRNLEAAREILEHELAKKPWLRDAHRMKQAQSLIGMVEWQITRGTRSKQKVASGQGLAGLIT